MKLTKQQYANLVHNCALVYNAVPRDVYMKFHWNVNKSDWEFLIQEKYNTSRDVVFNAFNWYDCNEDEKFWDIIHADLYKSL